MIFLLCSNFIGGFYLVVLFVFCFCVVCTFKILYLYFFPPKKEAKPSPPPEKKASPKRTRLPVRKIVIRPNEINKILVENDE